MKKSIIEGWIYHGYGPDTLTAIAGDGCGRAEYATVYLPEGWKHVGGNTVMNPIGEIYDLREAVQVHINQWAVRGGRFGIYIYAKPFKADLEGADDGECSDEEYKFVKRFFHNGPKDPLLADLEVEDALRLLQEWSDADQDRTMPRHMTAAKFARIWNEIRAETWEKFRQSELSRWERLRQSESRAAQ